MNKVLTLTIASALSITTLFSQEKKKDTIKTLKEVTINANYLFGSKFEARNKTGSATYISPEELKKFGYTDINRILKNVPGVNIYEEDGFGLRPNISLRGTSAERSSKITLMEDGILISPAPYSAPAAYYFPSVARMNAIEVLKGSSQIQYGPFTTGGAINFISAPIPKKFSGKAEANYGSFNSSRVNALVGGSNQNIGYSLQYLNYNSDGFKKLANNANTGFDKNDLVAKLHLNSNPNRKVINSLDLKVQYSDEVANETYLGLTQADFDKSPFMRYAGSQKDKITSDHHQIVATHTLSFSDYFRITTTAYRNTFSRNWYKLNDVKAGTVKKGISDILENPTTLSNHFAIINGTMNSGADALSLKANNRDYLSKGVQTKFDYHFTTNSVFHDIEIGARYHYDEEDRFQWVDGYNMVDGIMNLTSSGVHGSDANRISSAKAFSSHVLYKLKYKDFTIIPGLRFETIDLLQEDYGKNDSPRTGVALTKKDNTVNAWMPGIGLNYNFKNNISLFGGVHKGFAPPSNQAGQKPEESINVELGSRFKIKKLSGELIGFYNDYSNLLGSDLAASGGNGTLDQFNAGKVTVSGLELLLNYNVLKSDSEFALPLSLAYTFTDTEFLSSFGSPDELWGKVTAGDELPYISKHQMSASISLEHKKFEVNLSGKFNGAFRTKAGAGEIPSNLKVANNFVLDFASKFNINKYLSVMGTINNLLDSTYAVSRAPAGLRPGMPFSVSAGIIAQF